EAAGDREVGEVGAGAVREVGEEAVRPAAPDERRLGVEDGADRVEEPGQLLSRLLEPRLERGVARLVDPEEVVRGGRLDTGGPETGVELVEVEQLADVRGAVGGAAPARGEVSDLARVARVP